MKLLDLYEDFFQYVCRLNRVARTSAPPEFSTVRSEVKDSLAKITASAASDVKLLNQVKKLELPMIFFIDNMMCTSRLKLASEWMNKRLASERNELAGDERFFVDFLEKDLADTSEEAVERLAVYYVCLGLGFTGMYQNQPDQIRRYVDQIYARIPQFVDRDPRTKISEEAYQHTDTRLLTEPPSQKLVLVAIAFVFLALTVLTVCYVAYARAVSEVRDSIQEVDKQAYSGSNPPH